jgi:hypothetical protein
MSPTIFRIHGFRFFFFSREETRMHIHVQSSNGEAKFWLEPAIKLVRNHGLSETDLVVIESILKERKDEILDAWDRHFGTRSN